MLCCCWTLLRCLSWIHQMTVVLYCILAVTVVDWQAVKLFCCCCRAMMEKDTYIPGCMVWFLIACTTCSSVSISFRGSADIGLRWVSYADSLSVVISVSTIENSGNICMSTGKVKVLSQATWAHRAVLITGFCSSLPGTNIHCEITDTDTGLVHHAVRCLLPSFCLPLYEYNLEYFCSYIL